MRALARAGAPAAAFALCFCLLPLASAAYAEEPSVEDGSTQVTVISDAAPDPVAAAATTLAKTADSLGVAAPILVGAFAAASVGCAVAAIKTRRRPEEEGGGDGDGPE